VSLVYVKPLQIARVQSHGVHTLLHLPKNNIEVVLDLFLLQYYHPRTP